LSWLGFLSSAYDVAQLQAQLKRGILDELWYAVPEELKDGALEATIRAFKSARWDAIKTGTFVVSTSGGGYSVSFSMPELFRQLGPDQFFMLGQEFLDVMADAKVTVANAGQEVTDANVFDTMMADDRLQPGCRTTLGDFTMQRWPSIASRG
jgi:hypothetical protein